MTDRPHIVAAAQRIIITIHFRRKYKFHKCGGTVLPTRHGGMSKDLINLIRNTVKPDYNIIIYGGHTRIEYPFYNVIKSSGVYVIIYNIVYINRVYCCLANVLS